MKSFRDFIREGAPTNTSSGPAVRGFGDTSGVPTGDISNYAASNAAGNIGDSDSSKLVTAHNALHAASKASSNSKAAKKSSN